MPPGRFTAALLTGVVAALGVSLPGRAAPGGMIAGAHAGLTYKLHLPAARGEGPAPLVVMLHGCTQDPDQFATSTRMNALADREGFLVLYPGQSAIANPRRCWNWFMPAHQRRGAGEPLAITELVAAIAGQHGVDRRRVYVAGLSAGGAMAAVLGAAYPDVFAAVAVCAGLAPGVAHDVDSALAAMAQAARDPAAIAPRVKAMFAERARPVPLLVIHGSDDPRVVAANGDQLAAGWAMALGLPARPTETLTAAALPDTRPVERWTWRDADGRSVIERVRITGLTHAWPGGDAAGTHVDPVGPSGSEACWQFFSHRQL